MKIRTLMTALSATAISSFAVAAPITLGVSEDGFTSATNDGSGYGSNDVVQDGGTGDKLSIATPNPAGAWQYSRRAYFGFDVSSVDLSQVTAGSVEITTSSNVASSYNASNVIRMYLLSDLSGTDAFDETTLTWNGAATAGYMTKGNLLDDRVAGTTVAEVAVPSTAAGQPLTFDFSAAALAELANDTNSFLTFVVEYRGQNNGGFGDYTGLGFESKELTNGSPATLTLDVVPEPGSFALLTLGGLVIGLRRRR